MNVKDNRSFWVYLLLTFLTCGLFSIYFWYVYVEDLNTYLNQPIQVQVFDIDEEKKRLILSARELLRAKAEEEKKAKISNVEVGLVTEGTVESLQPYGAFVNLGEGISGLVHISQISEKRIKHPSAVLAVGDTVKVKVIAVKDGKLSLSMKALQDVAAEEIVEEFGAYLGYALADVAAVIDPSMFIIGGGVSKAGPIIIQYVKKYFLEKAFFANEGTEFIIAVLGNDAGMCGAAKLILG